MARADEARAARRGHRDGRLRSGRAEPDHRSESASRLLGRGHATDARRGRDAARSGSGSARPDGARQARRVRGGAVAPKAAWLADFWGGGRSRVWLLSQTPLLHVYGHYFEARVVRGLWGLRSP